MKVHCNTPSCPIMLDSKCAFYEGANLVYIGVNTNDSIQLVIEKLNTIIHNISPLSIGTTTKKTGIDAGIFGERSITDDYEYICVQGGIVGVAIWKKSVLFQT